MRITDNDIKKICSPTIYKRGLQYYKEGRVHLRVRKSDSIVAAVDGEELYNVHITFKDGQISDTFCTCPYYHTMGCACKHIVAVLKTRQSELEKNTEFSNENDSLAAQLCSEFESIPKEQFRISLTFRITPISGKLSYSAAFKLIGNNAVYPIQTTERFLDCFCSGKEFKLSKNKNFSNKNCSLDNASDNIINILSEAYENKTSSGELYSPRLYETSFGAATAKRLFPFLDKVDCEYIIDTISYSNLPIVNDDPDILVDITAMDKNINISVTESGIALTPDGELFFFENKIFKTSPKWRAWFMPFYNVMIARQRTLLEFSGNNSIEFAAKVLPNIRERRGVVCYGVDELIVSEQPVFEIYFDRQGNGISAVIKAIYGNISIILPAAMYTSEKIIVRNKEAENKILSFFSDFSLLGSTFVMSEDDDIFIFLTQTLHELDSLAQVYLSDSFKALYESDMPNISAFVNYNTKIDLLELTLDSELSENELSEILNAYYNQKQYYRFSNGNYLDFSKKNSMLELLSSIPADVSAGMLKKKQHISKFYALYLSAQVQKGTVAADESFSKMVDTALQSKLEIPQYLDNILRDYQKTGVQWFHQLSLLGLGGILADDMGLGKTLQVIAFVMSENVKTPVLVVAPSSLTYNWLNEIKRFAPDALAKIIDGPKEERENLLSSIDGYDFIITSYALLRRDIQIYQKLEFSYCFIDEAQHIKNPNTMNAHAVKKVNAGRYFALTGTPIENSLSELWSIFDFVLHGYLSTHKDFSAKYEKPAVKGNVNSIINNLRNKIKPFILRRMKQDVLSELPEKIENVVFADFESEQKQIYSAFLSAARKEADIIAQTGENTIRILSLLTRLRQICCHPGLINQEYKKESGKLILLKELVQSAVASGHRLLIFSQFTSMLDIINKKMHQMGIDCFYLDGSTPSAERINMANRFNNGEKDIFLISLKAGGTGLNLTGADMVIHYDPWWNPAVMDQASDRAYRIGQTRAVQVIKLAARGSIEEQILKLAEKKRGLADNVIRENKSLLSALTKEELLNLFKE